MMRMQAWLQIALAATLISGCSWFGDDDDNEIQPAELESFTEQVDIKRVWSKSVGGSDQKFWRSLRPSASDQVVYAANHQGEISALAVADGQQLWRTDLEIGLSGGVGYGAGMVMVGSIEGEVYALDADDGGVLWSSQLSSEVLTSPQSNGEVVVVQTIDDKIYALDAATGDERWQHDGDAPILSVRGTSSALVTDTMVLAGFDSGKLIAFNPENGALIWEARLALPKGRTELERMVDIDGDPLLVGDVIYAVSYQGRVGAITRGTGRNLWFQDSSSHQSPAHGQEQIYVTEADDTMRAFQAGSGRPVWANEQLFLRRLTAPTVFGSTVAVADAEGYLHLLDSVDGHFVGRTKVDGSGVAATMLARSDRLIVQANDGSLTAYRIEAR